MFFKKFFYFNGFYIIINESNPRIKKFMKIGIFSKFEMAGGSEFRGAEIASSIARHTEHEAFLLCEKGIPDKVRAKVNNDVSVVTNAIQNPNVFYEMDKLLIINTDSKAFTTVEYWLGKSERHNVEFDLTKIKQMTFLFNFIVSPARHLCEIKKLCNDVRILTTNKRFYNELSTKEKHELVKHFPRGILRSPINPSTIHDFKIASEKIRIGKHSKGLGGKWNEEHIDVIKRVNQKVGERVIWDFMGMPRQMADQLKDFPNVITRREFTVPVNDYLACIDIFFFFNSWKRQEPWARAMAEGMLAGCAVVATKDNAGNEEQVVHGNNGYICKNSDEIVESIVNLVNNPSLIKEMGKNNIIYSREFSSEQVIKQFLRFIE